MVRPKDPFWKYAVDLKNCHFSCKFCHGQFHGGISRIKWHLSGRKGHDIKVCERVPRDIQLAVQQVLDSYNKIKDRQVENENYSSPSSSGGPNLCMENHNSLMGQNNNNVREGDHNLSTSWPSRAPNVHNEKRQVLDKQLARFFFSFGIRPKAIVSPIFEDFVKSIVEYGPGYQLPSPFTLAKELMLDVKVEAEEYVENFINDSVQAGCTMMVNTWRDYDEFDENFINRVDIFAYSQRGAVCLMSCNYGSSKSLQEAIFSTIELFGPSHVVQLICYDHEYRGRLNGDFFTTMKMVSKKQYPWICVNRCVVDVIESFFSEMAGNLHSLIELVRLIFSYTYHHSHVLFRRGKKRPKEYFASIFFMLKSILEVEDELQALQFSMIISSSDQMKLLDEQEVAKHSRCAKLIDYIIHRNEFWSRVKAVAQVWFIVFQTRCLVDREDSTIGYLYEMIERLKDGIEKSREYDCFLYDFTWEIFSDMRREIIYPIHAAAAFLDPAYMCSDNFKENIEMIDGINYMFENMVELDEKEAFTKEVQQYRMKMPKLFTTHAITMLKTCHPRIWWDFCGKHIPVLRKYAIRILSQPCSNSFCRRYQVPHSTHDWKEDGSAKVNTIIMSRNSKSLELEPIILDKLGEDHNDFKGTEELVDECYIAFLHQLTDDAFVDRVIEDRDLSWLDNFEIYTFLFLLTN
ncbi:hypothetical protein I3760_13G030900 [Carya illinoinensis]|nr:hypothetical protein I3760_13G030900 [Carya illinoinensis]